jgi:hypothetical protein
MNHFTEKQLEEADYRLDEIRDAKVEMELSDTPRTDDQSVRYYDDATGRRTEYVASRFARQLERELTAARAEIERLNFSLKQASSIYDVVTEQRDRLAELLQEACDDPNIGNWYHAAQKALQSLITNAELTHPESKP